MSLTTKKLTHLNKEASSVYEKHIAGKVYVPKPKKQLSVYTEDQIFFVRWLTIVKGIGNKEASLISGVEYSKVSHIKTRNTHKSFVAPFEKPRYYRGKIVFDIDPTYDFKEYEQMYLDAMMVNDKQCLEDIQ